MICAKLVKFKVALFVKTLLHANHAMNLKTIFWRVIIVPFVCLKDAWIVVV